MSGHGAIADEEKSLAVLSDATRMLAEGQGRFRSGTSGNPSGRPKGFAAVAEHIIRATGNGDELVDWLLEVWRDKERPFSQRSWAWERLAGRGLGKPVTTAELNTTGADHVSLHLQLLSETHVQRKRRLDELEARAREAGQAETT
jgi:hypothetical protein